MAGNGEPSRAAKVPSPQMAPRFPNQWGRDDDTAGGAPGVAYQPSVVRTPNSTVVPVNANSSRLLF